MDKKKIVTGCLVAVLAGEVAHHRTDLFFRPVDHIPETPLSVPDYSLKETTVVASTEMSWNIDWIKKL